MEYVRVTSIDHPYFAAMHRLLKTIFPPEEVLAYELWEEPIADPDIYVYVAVLQGEIVGATEYRYYADMRVAMTDFTIISRLGDAIGRFLYLKRADHLAQLQRESGTRSLGMFAEVYNPQATISMTFGNVLPMHPVVRREVLSHLGYLRLQLDYVHPSWDHEGKAVTELDLGFQPSDPGLTSLPASLVVAFLKTYYAALPNKPREWLEMIERLAGRGEVPLLPL